MIHPSYSELMQEVNRDTESDEPPVVNSRYSIVLATSKRARQIIAGDTPLVSNGKGKKPLSIAIEELYDGKVKILAEEQGTDEEIQEEAEMTEEQETTETEASEADEELQEEPLADGPDDD